MNYIIREIKQSEYKLLDDFLYEAIFIPEGVDPPAREIIRQPELKVYIEDFGSRKDDNCLVAESGGKIVGAVWSRIMNDYGHVDDNTPSLAISLYEEYRGHGIGTLLMKNMLHLLKSKGYKRVSLSVQKANYAVKLYKKVGFTVFRESEDEYIMMCDFDRYSDKDDFGMKYINATEDMTDDIYNVMHSSITTVYPKYYPREVVDFFCNLHCRDHVLENIKTGNTSVLMKNGKIVGKGSFDKNHITGVYVLPEYQYQGCGTYIMDCLEKEIAKNYDTAKLDASLPAVSMYEHRGYKTIGHGSYDLENDARLVYEIMEKTLLWIQ